MAIETIGFVDVELTATNNEFIRGTQQAANAVQNLERDLTRQFRNITNVVGSFTTLIGGAAVASVAALSKEWAEGADAVGTFANRISISVEQLSRLQFVAEQANVPINTFNSSLQRQTRRLGEAIDGNKAYQEALADLGIEFKDIQNLNPDEAFIRIADAIGQINKTTEQTRLAKTFWDTEGVALIQIANLGADEIERLMMRSDELGATLSTSAATGANEFNAAMSEFTRTLNGLANTVFPLIIPPLTEILRLITDLTVAARNGGSSIAEFFEPITRYAVLFKFSDALRTAFPLLGGFVGTLSQVGREIETVPEKIRETAEATEELAGAAGTAQSAIQPLTIEIDRSSKVLEDFEKQLQDQLFVFDDTQAKIEALVTWYDRLDPTQQVQNQEFFNKLMKDFGFEVGDAFNKAEKAIVDWEQVGQRAMDDFIYGFEIFGDDLLAENDNIFESLKATALDILQDIVTAYATEKILLAIGAVVNGETPGGQTGGGAGDPQSAALGILGGIFSSFGGPLIGAAASIITGGILDSLTGGGNRIKETQLFLGQVQSPIQAPAFGNVENPFGQFTFGLRRFGNEGQLSNADARDLLQALTDVGFVINEIDEVIGATLSELQFDNIVEALREIPDRSLNYRPENIDAFIKQRYGIIFGSIDEALGEAFTQQVKGLEGDDILQFAQDVATVQAIFAEGDQIFDDVASAAETVNRLMEEFAARGETLAGVLERIGQATTILEPLGLAGGTAAGARFNLSVLEAFGNDAARLEALVGGFFDTFFSDLENLERSYESLGSVVTELLDDLGTTRETFATDFLALIEEGLLEPEDVRAWLEVSESVGLLIELEEELARVREDSARAAIADEVAAINAQINAQSRLLAVIDSVSAAIDQQFGRAIENIELSLLDQEGQYEFFQARIDALIESLDSISDPQLLADTLLQIEEFATRAFGLLSPEQQAIVGPGFIEFLNEQLTFGQERLTELQDQALAERDRLEEQRAQLEQQVAEQLQDGANTFEQGAVIFANSVDQFLDAVQTPQQVTVTVDSDLVGT